MKKIIKLSARVSTFVLGGLVTLKYVYAQNALDRMKNVASEVGYETEGTQTPQSIVANIIVIALGFVGLVFLVMLIYSGFQWMTAGGNEEKVREAKKRLQVAIIGLVIIIAAYAITTYVTRALIHATTRSYYSP